MFSVKKLPKRTTQIVFLLDFSSSVHFIEYFLVFFVNYLVSLKLFSIMSQEVNRVLEESKFDVHADAILHHACSIELQQHCSEIPTGDGRSKFVCLL